jgi:MFS transporter, Spinster family, sphingosine-1-phosphate transporter
VTPPAPTRAALGLLALLTALNVLNFIDRQLVGSLAPFLIAELGLSRAAIGLLQGFAFVLVYTVAGLLLGPLADRTSRPRLIAGGLAVWSAATALSGTARGLGHLALARMLVGVGEAALTPAALSMLADVLPASWLARAAGIYYAGVSIGAGLSLVVAGLIAPAFGWRACFLALGVAGLLAAAAMSRLQDPAGHQVAARAAVRGRAGLEIGRDLAALLRGAPALPLVMLGGALTTYAAASGIHWLTWLVHERGFGFRRAAFLAGVIYAVAGLCGNVLGGWFADWCERRWRGGRIWSMVVMVLALLPFALLFLFVPPNTPVFFACWFLTAMGSTTWYGPLFATTQEFAPPGIRSTTVAFLMLVINVLGVGLGPWITGLIGDRVSLTRGILVSLIVGACSVVPLAIAARRCERDKERVNPTGRAG